MAGNDHTGSGQDKSKSSSEKNRQDGSEDGARALKEKEKGSMNQSASGKAKQEKEAPSKKPSQDEAGTLIDRLSELTNSAFRLAKKTTGTSLKVGKALIRSQDQLKLMVSAGESLRDLREVAGLTISELTDALNLKDKTLLEAVENGTATLSFELILRLAALLARNDPIPFILRFTRTYNPEIWGILNDWGLGRIPLHFERERKFMNIYRSHDAARKLSDEGFEKVLEFTRKAFELSLHFIAEQEKIQEEENRSAEEVLTEELRQRTEENKNYRDGK